MGMDVMTQYSLPPPERAATARGAEVLNGRGPQDRVAMTVIHTDGSTQGVDISATAAGIICDLLTRLSVTENLAVLADDAELSPEDAATILGISRPLVRRRMDSGRLPFRRVGSHRRLRLADVLALKREEAPMRQALDDLQVDTDDLITQGL